MVESLHQAIGSVPPVMRSYEPARPACRKFVARRRKTAVGHTSRGELAISSLTVDSLYPHSYASIARLVKSCTMGWLNWCHPRANYSPFLLLSVTSRMVVRELYLQSV